jgi:hypothetical protein
MSLGNMRRLGVQRLVAHCLNPSRGHEVHGAQPVFDDRRQISFVPIQPHAINATGKKCHDRCANRCDDNINENHQSPPW